ncbi:MAG: hypothetical protein HY769_10035 [Candidatus Stahlbacteria bacterium]|nr:hypothetical protein [Candidatus Stahlbacteria bacterium]
MFEIDILPEITAPIVYEVYYSDEDTSYSSYETSYEKVTNIMAIGISGYIKF